MRLQGTYAERTHKTPKRTIVEQASKNVQYVSAEFFRSSEARLSSLSVFEHTGTWPLAQRGVRVGLAPIIPYKMQFHTFKRRIHHALLL